MALITAQQVKDRVDNRDLDTNLITTELIEMAEKKHLRPILTKDLYDALVADTVTYADLLAVCLDPLAWFVYFEIMGVYYISVTEQGLKFNQSERQNNISQIDYEKLKTWAYQTAMTFFDELEEHLENEDYTSFDTVKKIDTKILGGILL